MACRHNARIGAPGKHRGIRDVCDGEGLAALFQRLSKTSPRSEWKNDNGKF
jgi:hypothetical protein